MSREEMDERGWAELDVLLISGDAYFDHPSHGIAMIGRVLESEGYRVGIIARPDWKNVDDFKVMGRPALFVGISAGAVDSTINNYTADLAPRKKDVYAPAGDNSQRPNFATAVYCGAVKAAFPCITTVLGGIEASTRRFAYYDYLKKSIRRSILLDTRADILVFGPGEIQILNIADRLKKSKDLNGIRGTARLTKNISKKSDTTGSTENSESISNKLRNSSSHNALVTSNKTETLPIELPPFKDGKSFICKIVEQTNILERNLGPHKSERFSQNYQEGVVICEAPQELTTQDLDRFHNLPFTKKPHPSYTGQIMAVETIKHSIIAQRGCPGGCSFCALSYHQGRHVKSRSSESIITEIKELAKDDEFKGTITDIGGPTANAYMVEPIDEQMCKKCKRNSCMYPSICSNLSKDQSHFIKLLDDASKQTGVKHVFVASGIRHDLAMHSPEFIKALATKYTGGHLKAAPEHSDNKTLKLMRKPPVEVFEDFEKEFIKASNNKGKEQYVVPYFISGFPGCSKKQGDDAGNWLKKRGQTLEQVQNFIPLPGTMAAAMYAAKTDAKGNPIFIPDAHERKRQKQLLTGKTSVQSAKSRQNRDKNSTRRKHERTRRNR